jgi:hypothetical protein
MADVCPSMMCDPRAARPLPSHPTARGLAVQPGAAAAALKDQGLGCGNRRMGVRQRVHRDVVPPESPSRRSLSCLRWTDWAAQAAEKEAQRAFLRYACWC